MTILAAWLSFLPTLSYAPETWSISCKLAVRRFADKRGERRRNWIASCSSVQKNTICSGSAVFHEAVSTKTKTTRYISKKYLLHSAAVFIGFCKTVHHVFFDNRARFRSEPQSFQQSTRYHAKVNSRFFRVFQNRRVIRLWTQGDVHSCNWLRSISH